MNGTNVSQILKRSIKNNLRAKIFWLSLMLGVAAIAGYEYNHIGGQLRQVIDEDKKKKAKVARKHTPPKHRKHKVKHTKKRVR